MCVCVSLNEAAGKICTLRQSPYQLIYQMYLITFSYFNSVKISYVLDSSFKVFLHCAICMNVQYLHTHSKCIGMKCFIVQVLENRTNMHFVVAILVFKYSYQHKLNLRYFNTSIFLMCMPNILLLRQSNSNQAIFGKYICSKRYTFIERFRQGFRITLSNLQNLMFPFQIIFSTSCKRHRPCSKLLTVWFKFLLECEFGNIKIIKTRIDMSSCMKNI